MSTHEISLVEVDRKVEENSISHEVAEQMLMEEERLESVNMGISDAALIVVSFGGKRNEQQDIYLVPWSLLRLFGVHHYDC